MQWNGWSVYWGLWILIGFFVPELYALFSGNHQNTLSDQVWHIEGQGATCFRYVVGCFCAWLFFHMTFGMFRT
jgi:hypothetical protein